MTKVDEDYQIKRNADTFDNYFECITSCSWIGGEDIECVTRCISMHIHDDNEDGQ